MIKLFSLQIPKWSLLLCFGDMAAFSLAVPGAIVMTARGGADPWFLFDQYRIPLVLVGSTYVLVLYIANLYDYYVDFRRRDNFSRVILSCLIGTLVALFLFSFPSWRIIPRTLVEWHAVIFVWLVALWRYSFSALALPVKLQRKVLVVGAGTAGRWIAEVIRNQLNCGLAVRGFVDDDPQKLGLTIDGLKVVGQSSEMEELIRREKANLMVLAVTHEKTPFLVAALNRATMRGCELIDVPKLCEFLAGKIPVDHISDTWIFYNNLTSHNLYHPRLKRLLDLVLASLGLLITLPLLIIIALAIKLDSPGPVFFRQRRLGLNGEPFCIVKFRTMIVDAGEDIPRWAAHNDSRVTRVGGLLRKMHLDELPQLINILKGEMSLIGPRAEWEVFAHKSQEPMEEWRPGRRASDPAGIKVCIGYREQIPYYSQRLLVKPGVTGWAQVKFPHAGSSLEDMKEKLEYDLYYIKNLGILLDISILLKTIRIVLFGHGK